MKALSARQAEVMTMIENNRMAPVKYRTTVNSLVKRGLIAPTGEESAGMIVCRLIPAEVKTTTNDEGCRSLNHVYCVGPCPKHDRNEANASAARTHVETEAECLARIKREDFRVGDAYTFRSMVGYRLYQDRPFTCRGLECQCGKACHGTVVESLEILTDVAHYVSGGLEIQGHKGSRAVIRPDRLD